MFSQLTFRRRLTLWYVVLLAVTLLLFGAGIYAGLRTLLFEQFEDQARTQAALLQSAVEDENGQLTWDRAEIAAFQEDDNFVRLLAPDGAALFDSSAVVEVGPVDPRALTAALAGETTFAIDTDARETMGIVSMPVREGEPVAGVLQVGVSRGDVDEVLRNLLVVLAIGTPLAVALAAICSHIVAGRAIAPVTVITGLAARIEGDDLTARLDLDLPDDELGRLASTFNQMLARIETAFEQQRLFTAGAAHELRTPLAILQAQIEENLATTRPGDPQHQQWQQAATDVERMQSIVAALLTLARIDAGALLLETEPFDLAETINLVVDQMQAAATAAGVTLTASGVSTSVVADEDLLIQLAVNLVDNAIRNTPPGGAVEAGSGRDDGQVRLWVTDNGAGIPLEQQARIFDRFYRVDQGRSREHGGAGLGLAICRAIARAHGGEITVESASGRGSRFEVVLPASPGLHLDLQR